MSLLMGPEWQLDRHLVVHGDSNGLFPLCRHLSTAGNAAVVPPLLAWAQRSGGGGAGGAGTLWSSSRWPVCPAGCSARTCPAQGPADAATPASAATADAGVAALSESCAGHVRALHPARHAGQGLLLHGVPAPPAPALAVLSLPAGPCRTALIARWTVSLRSRIACLPACLPDAAACLQVGPAMDSTTGSTVAFKAMELPSSKQDPSDEALLCSPSQPVPRAALPATALLAALSAAGAARCAGGHRQRGALHAGPHPQPLHACAACVPSSLCLHHACCTTADARLLPQRCLTICAAVSPGGLRG